MNVLFVFLENDNDHSIILAFFPDILGFAVLFGLTLSEISVTFCCDFASVLFIVMVRKKMFSFGSNASFCQSCGCL